MNVETIYVDGLVETIKRRLLNGSGFAWMPETAIAAELASEDLVPIGDESWSARLTIAALANPETLARQPLALWDSL
jgi:DNA-binding transcriptional LysR family regulator